MATAISSISFFVLIIRTSSFESTADGTNSSRILANLIRETRLTRVIRDLFLPQHPCRIDRLGRAGTIDPRQQRQRRLPRFLGRDYLSEPPIDRTFLLMLL